MGGGVEGDGKKQKVTQSRAAVTSLCALSLALNDGSYSCLNPVFLLFPIPPSTTASNDF